MYRADVAVVRTLMRQLAERLDAAEIAGWYGSPLNADGTGSGPTGTAESGAAIRTSMELTRALAQLRGTARLRRSP